MRLFVAIELPKELKDYAVEIGKHLHEFNHLQEFNLRYVKPENMEITLAFLGEVEDKSIGSVIESLKAVRFHEFTLKTQGYGFFPSEKNIRVVWIGLEKNDGFMKLQHDIRDVFGHKDKFMPHITIARAKQLITKDAGELDMAMKRVKYQEIGFSIRKFALFSSELTPQGPIHTLIEEFSAELDPSRQQHEQYEQQRQDKK